MQWTVQRILLLGQTLGTQDVYIIIIECNIYSLGTENLCKCLLFSRWAGNQQLCFLHLAIMNCYPSNLCERLFGLFFISFVMYGRWVVLAEVNRQNLWDGWICFHEPEPSGIKARTHSHLKNNVMIGYWYTFEPYFLLGKTASVQFL